MHEVKTPGEITNRESNSSGSFGLFTHFKARSIIQIWPEPAFDFLNGHAFAGVVVVNLVAVEFAHGKIFGIRMGEVKPAHRTAGPHGAAFGQLNARAFL